MGTATSASALLRPRWLLIAILVLETLVAGFDAHLVWQCHHIGGECWPFFSSFMLNLPLSIFLSDLIAALPGLLSIDPSSNAQIYASAFMYAFAGTLWWGGIVVLLRAIATGAIGSVRRSRGDV